MKHRESRAGSFGNDGQGDGCHVKRIYPFSDGSSMISSGTCTITRIDIAQAVVVAAGSSHVDGHIMKEFEMCNYYGQL